MEIHKRKPIRLKGYDYSLPGRYFITICTQGRKQILSQIEGCESQCVGDDALIVPKPKLTKIGIVCDNFLNSIGTVYKNIIVEKYVIMPNHIHLLLLFDGTMKASSPTKNLEALFVLSNGWLLTKRVILSGNAHTMTT